MWCEGYADKCILRLFSRHPETRSSLTGGKSATEAGNCMQKRSQIRRASHHELREKYSRPELGHAVLIARARSPITSISYATPMQRCAKRLPNIIKHSIKSK